MSCWLWSWSTGRSASDSPNREEYLARFPEHTAIIDLALAELHSGVANSLAAGTAQTEESIPPFLLNHPRYQVQKFLGRGGMGTVFLAQHRALEKTVALKIIRPELLADPSVVQHFRGEAKAAASLNDPHIVAVYDAETTGDLHFLVMEYIPGTDLARLVLDGGPLPLPTACDYIRQAAAGLQQACQRGLVHRDITPRNLMLTDQGQIKVLDFGLAQFLNRPLPTEQQAGRGSLLGSIDYMAPEQAANPQAADIRADIYSLGCTLYFLLTGQPPFPTGSLLERLRCHAEQPPPRIDQQCTGIPAEFVRVLDRMLAKDPTARFQTPVEVATALAPFTIEGSKSSRGRRWLLAVAALLLFGVLAAGWSLRIWPPSSAAVQQTPAQVEAERLYREGLHLLAQRKESQVRLAIQRFQAAIKQNPNFPLAQTALADAFNLCGDYGWDMADAVFPQAKQAASRAIEQDPNLAEAHLALAFVLDGFDCDRTAARKEYLAAIDRNSRLAEAHHWYAWFLAEEGRFSDADEQIALARQLAARRPDHREQRRPAPLSGSQVPSGRQGFSIRSGARAGISQGPSRFGPGLRRARQPRRGDPRARSIPRPDRRPHDTTAAEAYAYARNNRSPEARELLAQLEPLADSKPVAYEVAAVYAALGEKDQALNWLKRAFREHSAVRGSWASTRGWTASATSRDSRRFCTRRDCRAEPARASVFELDPAGRIPYSPARHGQPFRARLTSGFFRSTAIGGSVGRSPCAARRRAACAAAQWQGAPRPRQSASRPLCADFAERQGARCAADVEAVCQDRRGLSLSPLQARRQPGRRSSRSGPVVPAASTAGRRGSRVVGGAGCRSAIRGSL